jgi:lysine 2,3-aminomutase
VHCRFCFRRDQLDTPGGTLNGEELAQALDYITQNKDLWEIILTGGEPLMLPDRFLANVIEKLNAISHVKIIRIHTRIPVVDPARVTHGLIAALRGRAPVYVLLHCNHPRELTVDARAACARLIDAGFPMLSQSVLLRGVNDEPETLAQLMRAFVECRVKPHYLHHADKARGTSHFRVPIDKGQELIRGLRGHVSGLAQPTYMLDIPGGHGKVPVGPDYVKKDGAGCVVEDYKGREHNYHDRG